jgi:hypothetical protein
MNLNDRPTDDVPTGASDFGDMAPVFERHRASRTKNDVVDWSPLELSLLIDRGLLGHQFLVTDDIERITQWQRLQAGVEQDRAESSLD